MRIIKGEARRRIKQAEHLGPRQAMTGEALAPVWEATAAAQAARQIGAEHVEVIEKFLDELPGLWMATPALRPMPLGARGVRFRARAVPSRR